ncbi:hypothetical protein LXL04_001377 [Taraxacum kok-saghyz]
MKATSGSSSRNLESNINLIEMSNYNRKKCRYCVSNGKTSSTKYNFYYKRMPISTRVIDRFIIINQVKIHNTLSARSSNQGSRSGEKKIFGEKKSNLNRRWAICCWLRQLSSMAAEVSLPFAASSVSRPFSASTAAHSPEVLAPAALKSTGRTRLDLPVARSPMISGFISLRSRLPIQQASIEVASEYEQKNRSSAVKSSRLCTLRKNNGRNNCTDDVRAAKEERAAKEDRTEKLNQCFSL